MSKLDIDNLENEKLEIWSNINSENWQITLVLWVGGVNKNRIHLSLYLSIYHDMPVFKLKKTHAPVGWRSLFSINKDVIHAGHYKGMEQEQ